LNTRKRIIALVCAVAMFVAAIGAFTIPVISKQSNEKNVTEKTIDTTIHNEEESTETENPTSHVEETPSETVEKVQDEATAEAPEQVVTNEQVVEKPVTDGNAKHYSDRDAVDIAKVLYKECRGVPSKTEQACVAWTILNRVDLHSSTVYSIVRSPGQYAFSESTIVDDTLLSLAYDVLERWSMEKDGVDNVGRVLPKDYTYFNGKNGRNWFRNSYSGSYSIWDYSLPSPYEN